MLQGVKKGGASKVGICGDCEVKRVYGSSIRRSEAPQARGTRIYEETDPQVVSWVLPSYTTLSGPHRHKSAQHPPKQ